MAINNSYSIRSTSIIKKRDSFNTTPLIYAYWKVSNFHFLNLQVIFLLSQMGKLEEVNWLFAAMKDESSDRANELKDFIYSRLVYIMRKSFLLINTFNDKSFWNCWLGKILKHTCFQWWKFPKLDTFWNEIIWTFMSFISPHCFP